MAFKSPAHTEPLPHRTSPSQNLSLLSLTEPLPHRTSPCSPSQNLSLTGPLPHRTSPCGKADGLKKKKIELDLNLLPELLRVIALYPLSTKNHGFSFSFFFLF